VKSTFWAPLVLHAMLAGADTTPPSTPAQLYVASVTSTSVSLQWRASTDGRRGSGLAGYDMFENGSAVASTLSTKFTVTGLAPSTTFRFAVRARDKAGNVSELGNPISATTMANSCTSYPATPAGLQVTSVSSSTANLLWNAVAPPAGCTVTYSVYRDGIAIASGLTAATYNASGLPPSTVYQFAVAATDVFGSSGLSGLVGATTAAGGGTGGFPAHLFAPYIDMLEYPAPSLADIATATGQKYFSMAFVVARRGCQASWGGSYTIAQNFEVNDVAALRAQGGDVIVSFGGADGTELALACSSVSALQAQYQAVIDKYNLTRVDFDVEGAALGNTASIDRRNKAIAALQAAAAAAGKTLVVQYTLPVLPTGLTSQCLSLLQNALTNGVQIGIVNVMTMDYGSDYDPNQMGAYAVDAMNATIAQVAALYGAAKSDAEVRAMIGVTPEIGLNDVTPEVFTLGDASTVVSAAQSGGIGMLTFWSTGRDRQCLGAPVVSGMCSGIIQSPGAFTNIFRLFTEY
jgi:hypothetical protein